MKFASATNLDRNSGVAKWRDLLCAFTSNQGPTSELANPATPFVHWERSRGICSAPFLQTKAPQVSSRSCPAASSDRSHLSLPASGLAITASARPERLSCTKPVSRDHPGHKVSSGLAGQCSYHPGCSAPVYSYRHRTQCVSYRAYR